MDTQTGAATGLFDLALAAIAQRDGGIHCNQTMLLLHALARTLRWRCDIHASALRHLARE